jgi:hypothetical protein
VPGRIREDLADQLARAIHQAYLKNRAGHGDSSRLNQSMRPWEELPDDLRQANLAQAAHIGTKLDAIDCAVVPESAAPQFSPSPERRSKCWLRWSTCGGRKNDAHRATYMGRIARASSTPI